MIPNKSPALYCLSWCVRKMASKEKKVLWLYFPGKTHKNARVKNECWKENWIYYSIWGICITDLLKSSLAAHLWSLYPILFLDLCECQLDMRLVFPNLLLDPKNVCCLNIINRIMWELRHKTNVNKNRLQYHFFDRKLY